MKINFFLASSVNFLYDLLSFSIKSHLLIAIIIPLPSSWAYPAILVSCSVTPSRASINKIHTSALSIAAHARKTLYFSILLYTLLFRLTPAVSINVYFLLFLSTGVSIASLVVPATLLTITRSSPRILLI